jgi:hypothetical protein
MSVQPKQKTPKLDPPFVNQSLSGRKTAGEIEDLLKDLTQQIEGCPGSRAHLTRSISYRPGPEPLREIYCRAGVADHSKPVSRRGTTNNRVPTCRHSLIYSVELATILSKTTSSSGS